MKMYIYAVYKCGETNYPISRITDVDFFQILQNDIYLYENIGTVIIAGLK